MSRPVNRMAAQTCCWRWPIHVPSSASGAHRGVARERSCTEREGRGDPIESFRRAVVVRLSRLLEAFRCRLCQFCAQHAGVLVPTATRHSRLVA